MESRPAHRCGEGRRWSCLGPVRNLSSPNRRWRGRGGYGLTVCCIGLHQFNASAIGIEQVRLPLSIDPSSYLDGPGVTLTRGTRFKTRDRLLDVRNDETDVILHSHLRSVLGCVVEHKLEIVITIRHPHIDPTQHLAG